MASAATVPKIRLAGVAKRFGSKIVLDGVNLAIEPGESVAIIGGSGTGKSVTLKCILGLLRPDRGAIEVDGVDVVRLGGAERDRVLAKFGMLFQGGALFDSLPVWRNVTFGLTRGRQKDVARMRAVAEENLERVGLGRDILNVYPAERSGGMQKRVALARALAPEPGARSDPRRRHQRSHRQPRRGSGRHRAHHHPRHGVRAQDREPGGDAVSGPHHLARSARPAV